MPARRLMIAFNHAHGRLYAATGGRIAGRMAGHPVLLLETTGRRTGLRRCTPVQYIAGGEELLVVAAGGGRPQPPAWLLNLKADPDVHVTLGRLRVGARARVLAGDERERVWHEMLSADHRLAGVERHAGHPLPIVAFKLTVPSTDSDASQWRRERASLASAGPRV